MEREIDILWVLISSALVFIMQAGFLTLEIGLTRSKNNINVALKNLIDFAITTLVFWAFGYALMFGPSLGGLIGTGGFFVAPSITALDLLVFLIFQVMFCGTSVTIIAGAIAERMHFGSFALMVLVVSGLIYPVFGHWAWNGALEGTRSGWLGSAGFVDFAGSTVVHSIGGWVSLALLLIIGPRTNRFNPDGTSKRIPGSNIALSALGVFLLWFGWIGFNGGSTLAFDARVPSIIFNTMLAASAGMVAALAAASRLSGRPEAGAGMNGALAGLVAITAGCHAVTPLDSVIIGAIGAFVMLATEWLLERLRIDDAVGAIPVHLGAGIWGTLAVGLFGQATLLNTGLERGGQILIQLIGIVAAGVWVLPVTYIIFRVINSVRPLRVSVADEMIGLNASEHGATTEMLDFVQVLTQQAHTGDLSLRAPVEPFTEVGQIAERYNDLMDRLETETALNRAIFESASDGIIAFSRGTLIISSVNPAASMIFGYRPDAMLGQPLTAFLDAPDSQGISLDPATLDRVLELKLMEEGGRVVLLARRIDGITFPVEMTLAQATLRDQAFYTAIFRVLVESAHN